MKIQSTHSYEDRGLDAYFTPPEAIKSLIRIESSYIPRDIWEPACGDGAISKVLSEAGYLVTSSDIQNYGWHGAYTEVDYLKTDPNLFRVEGIVTNPPYKLAEEFIRKAMMEVPYSAFLLRSNFLESVGRIPLFSTFPPTIVYISSRRLPMMHRYGWEGPTSTSNTCYAWFVWDMNRNYYNRLAWFDWKKLCES